MYDETGSPVQQRDEELLRHLADAMADPLRMRILAGVSERPGITIRQLAEWLGEANRKVRYHVEALHDQGVLEVQSEGRRRGAIERQYRMTTNTYLDIEDWRALSDGLTLRISIQILKMVMADVAGSLAAGRFGIDDRDCVLRVRGKVDKEARSALSELTIRACQEAQEIVRHGTERLEKNGEEGLEMTSALLLFEAPIWDRA
jgi:DNA-binding transcriptional ArsR family regulator